MLDTIQWRGKLLLFNVLLFWEAYIEETKNIKAGNEKQKKNTEIVIFLS